MIYKKKGSRYYMAKFMWRGEIIRKSTRATDKKTARSVEAKVRVELAKGNWNILEAKPAPTLREFLQKEFLPFVQTKSKTKPKTAEYYEYGAKRLLRMSFADLRLNEITDQHSGYFASKNAALSASTINSGLRTLRRALFLAVQWGRLEKMPKITLAKGERQRERVLTPDESRLYLEACAQPWRDAALIMLGTGMRPGEVFQLRWEHVLLNGNCGLLHVVAGKSRAARRIIPMVRDVFVALKRRHKEQGEVQEGWVFPSASRSGHFEQDSAKNQHSAALRLLNRRAKENVHPKQEPPFKPFEPYCLRHTALTRLAESGCDAFTLARIAGHSSITITQRYCHPQADAIERAFAEFSIRQQLVTEGGHQGNVLPAAIRLESVATDSQ
jgi:integrase